MIAAAAPAKLIISGEHAIVYGRPALAMAVNSYAKSVVAFREAPDIFFDFTDLNAAYTLTIPYLETTMRNIEQRYQCFLKGDLDIKHVFTHPNQLIEYAFIHCIKNVAINISKDLALTIRTSSDIPIGCGMGSSAAILISFLHAINKLLSLQLSFDDYLHYGRCAENLQHGKSSGIDLFLALHGGCYYFANGQINKRELPKITIQIINTGKPLTNTGKCVSHVATKYKNHKIFDDFAAVTTALDAAMLNNDHTIINDCIYENELLLEKIGVVPAKVKAFIDELKNRKISAKITGAGAIAGTNAGIVLVIGSENISDLVEKYGYQYQTISGENNGVKLL
jgi:mevalonate kinase